MTTELSQIEFYFPPKKSDIKNKTELAGLIVSEMKANQSLDYCGFINEKFLQECVLNNLGSSNDLSQYSTLSEVERKEIEKIIRSTVLKCNQVLPVPAKNYIFVLPYFPAEEDKVFEGVMGFTPYNCVFYIFLEPKSWTPTSLANTVAHELNHAIFFYNHDKDFDDYTLLDSMIMEGLAENFRERVLGGESAPWAIALTRDEAFKTLQSMNGETLTSQDQDLESRILFGDETYPRWTGYSIGYWLIKELLNKEKNTDWQAIMKMSAHDILNRVLEKE